MPRRAEISKISCNLYLPLKLLQTIDKHLARKDKPAVLSKWVAEAMQEKYLSEVNSVVKEPEPIKTGLEDIELSLESAIFDIFSESEYFHNFYYKAPEGDVYPIHTPESGEPKEVSLEMRKFFDSVRQGLTKTVAKYKLYIDKLKSRD